MEVVLDVPDGDLLPAWANEPHKKQAASVVFFDANGGRAIETLRLPAAYCVSYHEQFAHGDAQSGSYQCTLTLSDPTGWTIAPGGPAAAFVAPAARSHGIGGASRMSNMAIRDAPANPHVIEQGQIATNADSEKIVIELAAIKRRDATKAEEEEISIIRKNHIVSKKKNVAYAEGKIDGKYYKKVAYSGVNLKPGTAGIKPFNEQILKTRPTTIDLARGVDDIEVRAYDSEVKILEELLDETAENPNVTGVIKIVSERPICDSCWDAITQFEKLRPNIKVERVQLPQKLELL